MSQSQIVIVKTAEAKGKHVKLYHTFQYFVLWAFQWNTTRYWMSHVANGIRPKSVVLNQTNYLTYGKISKCVLSLYLMWSKL